MFGLSLHDLLMIFAALAAAASACLLLQAVRNGDVLTAGMAMLGTLVCATLLGLMIWQGPLSAPSGKSGDTLKIVPRVTASIVELHPSKLKS